MLMVDFRRHLAPLRPNDFAHYTQENLSTSSLFPGVVRMVPSVLELWRASRARAHARISRL
jgi:hypothetical protein